MKTEYTVAMELASLCGAYNRCIETNNPVAEDHAKTIRWLKRQFLPRGSGINRGCEVDVAASNDEKIVILCDYHHMNDGGYYDGWTKHVVTVRPGFRGLRISIRGRNRNDVHDYLYEVFDSALNEVCHKIEDGKNEYGWYFTRPGETPERTSAALGSIYGKSETKGEV